MVGKGVEGGCRLGDKLGAVIAMQECVRSKVWAVGTEEGRHQNLVSKLSHF